MCRYGLYNGQDWRDRVEKATDGQFVRIPTQDGRDLDGLYVEVFGWAVKGGP